MSARISRALLLPLLITLTSAWAQTKIGYVDWEELIESAPQIGVARDRLDAEFRPRNETIEDSEKQLREMEERLIRDAAVMSEEQRQILERSIRTLRRDVQRDKEDLREELDYRLQEERQRVEQEIYEIVRRFAEDSDYDLIIPGPALFASDAINLTEQLLERLRSSFESTAAPDPPPEQ